MNSAMVRLIWRRALGRCEYCHVPQSAESASLQIDHVIARKHRGPTQAENLCLSCSFCNGSKGTDLSSVDPDTGKITLLYHPRRHQWHRHFRWDGAALVGKTPRGRATVCLLQINNPDRIILRELLIAEGSFPAD